VPVLSATSATVTAAGQCAGGRPQLTGLSSVSGLSVLGRDLSPDQSVDEALAIDSEAVDPSLIDLTKVTLPPPLNALPLATVQAQLQPLLDALPNVPVPSLPARIQVTPSSQTVANGTLTQAGPRVVVTVVGQPIIDAALGRASVTQADVCTQSASEAQLACTTRKLRLIDVLQSGDHVELYGAADRSYIGRRVRIVSSWDGRTVATPMVAQDGTFRAESKLPPRSVRRTNLARYEAQVGDERSLRLKLFRRMLVTELSSEDGEVTIKGRVVLPLGTPIQEITITRRVSCTHNAVVKTLKPDRDGHFSVTISGPPDEQAAVYRLATKVPKSRRNPKLFPTFTLPRAVELRQ
jgi:hypothetical protein